jgi:hypothetical protein
VTIAANPSITIDKKAPLRTWSELEEHKGVDESLEASRAMYRSLLENIHNIIYETEAVS